MLTSFVRANVRICLLLIRVSTQYQVRHVLFSRCTDMTALGGLPGLLLTADMVSNTPAATAAPVALHGPRQLAAVLHATRHFMHPYEFIFMLIMYIIHCVIIFAYVNRGNQVGNRMRL